jgi:GcrA cell cycle regulator
MHDAAWTAERIDLLKKLWAAGETAAVIAAHLGGMSRSAVLGTVFRLRLRADGTAAESQARPKSTTRIDGARTIAPARRRRSAERMHSQSTPKLGRRHKSLLELTNETCRFPTCRHRRWRSNLQGDRAKRNPPIGPRHAGGSLAKDTEYQ